MQDLGNTKDFWFGCSHVYVDGESIGWELDPKLKYGLPDIYDQKPEPHHELLRATDDRALADFVRKWGPLTRRRPPWKGGTAMAEFRWERDRFEAWSKFVSAIQNRADFKEPMVALLSWLERETVQSLYPRLCFGDHRHQELIQRVAERLRDASQDKLNSIRAKILKTFPMASLGLRVDEGIEHGSPIKTVPEVRSLPDALYWCLVIRKRISFCQQCQRFVPEGTKFCLAREGEPVSPCAKRWNNAVNWRAHHGKGLRYRRTELPQVSKKEDDSGLVNDRDNKRKPKNAGPRKGKKRGTQKTR